MERTLYVETNLILAVAKGQDPDAASFLESDASGIQLVIPGICIMEAFSVWEWEIKVERKFRDMLEDRSREVSRDLTSSRAQLLLEHLDKAIIESDRHITEVGNRLDQTLETISVDANIIEINSEILFDAIYNEHIEDSTDNLILSSILWHARQHPKEYMAFLSTNHKDFGEPDIIQLLLDAQVKYFRGTKAAMGWLHSRTSS